MLKDKLMFSFLNQSKIGKSEYITEYAIKDPALLNGIIKNNRSALTQVKDWIPEEIFETAYFDYGIPHFLKPIINLPVGSEKIYTDLICYYSRFLKKINYLELGVSVGKNFYQLANHFQQSSLTAYDIENINPVLEKNLNFIEADEWETKTDSIRKENSKLSSYKFQSNGNEVKYLAGDIWDENSWEKLEGNRFNIIFSDALHDPKALLWEYEMIMKFNLLDDDFIFIWDDLNHGLEESFYEIAKRLKRKYKLNKYQIILGKVNGWCGVNEQLHDVGIVSSLKLS